jgi:hypothetical protein
MRPHSVHFSFTKVSLICPIVPHLIPKKECTYTTRKFAFSQLRHILHDSRGIKIKTAKRKHKLDGNQTTNSGHRAPVNRYAHQSAKYPSVEQKRPSNNVRLRQDDPCHNPNPEDAASRYSHQANFLEYSAEYSAGHHIDKLASHKVILSPYRPPPKKIKNRKPFRVS